MGDNVDRNNSKSKKKTSLMKTTLEAQPEDYFFEKKLSLCVTIDHNRDSPLKHSDELPAQHSQIIPTSGKLPKPRKNGREWQRKMSANQVSIKFPQLALVKETLAVGESNLEPLEDKKRRFR
jgi:hypothetical protein